LKVYLYTTVRGAAPDEGVAVLLKLIPVAPPATALAECNSMVASIMSTKAQDVRFIHHSPFGPGFVAKRLVRFIELAASALGRPSEFVYKLLVRRVLNGNIAERSCCARNRKSGH
jgi:hypothetical protein